MLLAIALDNGKNTLKICSLYFTPSLHFTPGLQSAIRLESAIFLLHWPTEYSQSVMYHYCLTLTVLRVEFLISAFLSLSRPRVSDRKFCKLVGTSNRPQKWRLTECVLVVQTSDTFRLWISKGMPICSEKCKVQELIFLSTSGILNDSDLNLSYLIVKTKYCVNIVYFRNLNASNFTLFQTSSQTFLLLQLKKYRNYKL